MDNIFGGKNMELYNKETLKALKESVDDSTYYLPKALFQGSKFGNIRLETKLAYAALLDTLLRKPVFNQENIALLKIDNPVIAQTLAAMANKEVNQAKVAKYLDELIEANLIEINKQDIYIYHIDYCLNLYLKKSLRIIMIIITLK